MHVVAAMPNLKYIVTMGEPALRWVSRHAASELESKAAANEHKKWEKRQETYQRKLAAYRMKLTDYAVNQALSLGKKRKPPKTPAELPPEPALASKIKGYAGVTKWRGSILRIEIEGRSFWLYPVMHPASVMAFRQPRLRSLFALDWMKLAKHARGELPVPGFETTSITNGAQARAWFAEFPLGDIAIDIENSSERNTLECFAVGGGLSYAIVPWRDLNIISQLAIAEVIRAEFAHPGRLWGGHNTSGYDERKMTEYGLPFRSSWDSLCGFHVLFAELGSTRDDTNEDASQASGYDLGFVTSVLTPFSYHKGVVSGTRDAATVPNDELYPYCVLDVRASWWAMARMRREFTTRYGDGSKGEHLMLKDIERARRAAQMSLSGLPILAERRSAKLQELEGKALSLEVRAREITGDPGFNPHSKPQLAKKLQSMGVRLSSLTPTGRLKLDGKVMAKLGERYPDNPLVQVDQELRGLREKEIAVYEALKPRPDGSAPVSWKVHGTVGARWSSTPNAQNLTQLQKCAIGATGFQTIVVDLSAAELWVIASLAGQRDLLEQLRNDESPHAATCAQLFGREIDKRTNPEEYVFAKSANYRWCYTLPDEALSMEGGQLRTNRVDVDPGNLARVTAWLNRRWSSIVAWKRRTIREVESTGFAYSPQGRFRDLRWAVKSHAKHLRHHAHRAAINFPIQTCIGDVVGDAFVEAWDALQQLNRREARFVARLFANEHDSLAAIARPEYVEEVSVIIKTAMTRPIATLGGLCIPAEVKVGPSWGEAR